MAEIHWVLVLSLLVQGCECSMGTTDKGCKKWSINGDNACCEICHPGNRLVKECGPDPKALCVPCGSNTFTTNPLTMICDSCRQCVEALVFVKECTATSDTVCRCKEGLTCGNDPCTFCIKKCDKGQERTDDSSCRPCPEGTFNNQTQQKCKPWSKKCLDPDEQIVANGDAFSDIKCSKIAPSPAIKPESTTQEWPLIWSGVGFGTILICVIIAVVCAIRKRRPREEKEPEKMSETMIIRPPSDEPRTLIAIDCSFHEAQQEQGSSLESLNSKDSSEQLLP
ncbi:tumor necrosis factor receptor superfamily member 9a [Notolabrus celidotus]|uniref:tumor necrosis factor receptor superfamily member 9a n=1 Tax=Notolabrus celidotus TaxID=1203425 RepID=UPI00148FB6BB|nr:tumor necrosis factor receptor superfamily member 9a [Notolabrus celidotus]